ncbi:MAG: ABC transporter permease [Gemmatimonadetes bacterium]|nr:ABC transporter permease [Gemmatimonadota bacterium]
MSVPMLLPLLLRRLAWAAMLFWLVVTLIFVLVRLAPGDPATFLVPPTATAEDAERVRADLGLDQTVVVQYAQWVGALVQGDLGESFALGMPVSQALAESAPTSFALGLASLLLTFILGGSLGAWQAARRNRLGDRVATFLSAAVFAAPAFWVALALVAFFTYGVAVLGLPASWRLPALGVRSPGLALTGWADTADLIRHAILPVTTLTIIGAAGVARYARSAFLDVRDQVFVRAARARGVSAARSAWLHVLPNAAPSLVVLFALTLPGIVAGSVFVESVFAWPGLGRLTLSAIAARDYPVVLGASVWYAAAVILANLLADLALPVLDPRRRAS